MREIPLGAKGTFTLVVLPQHLASQFKDAILPPVLATPMDAGAQLEHLFGKHQPAFVLARFPTYGCYALRIAPGP